MENKSINMSDPIIPDNSVILNELAKVFESEANKEIISKLVKFIKDTKVIKIKMKRLGTNKS